jgi:hypothetical protein
MNPDTLVAVSCYAGDKNRVLQGLDVWLAHECPVVLLSPADAPVWVDHPRVVRRSAGHRGVQGQAHLDRWDEYFRMLLEFPQNNFLICDSDSFCLSPKLPDRFYQGPDTFWSFHHPEGRPHTSPYPKVAYQSPMFISRANLEKLMSVDRAKVPAHPITPFQDWYLVALACESGVLCKHNEDGASYMGWNGAVGQIEGEFRMGPEWRGEDRMVSDVLAGTIFVHSVRHAMVLARLLQARRDYVARHQLTPEESPATISLVSK